MRPPHGIRRDCCRKPCARAKGAIPDVGRDAPSVALDPYTSHGQDGLHRRCTGYVANDRDGGRAGAAGAVPRRGGRRRRARPSDMMDGRIGAHARRARSRRLRQRADPRVFGQVRVGVLAGRFAMPSGRRPPSSSGNKYTYQMDPANGDEALCGGRTLDLQEGADMVMVKPGLPTSTSCAG